ncbi:hypothetical protein NIES4102_41880 (plasmid) [Chondrocystis sp. NIES-4102]|nr:hypothetical protein NIES4102_41880 [Chondrocystis sp. NIES-4102]
MNKIQLSENIIHSWKIYLARYLILKFKTNRPSKINVQTVEVQLKLNDINYISQLQSNWQKIFKRKTENVNTNFIKLKDDLNAIYEEEFTNIQREKIEMIHINSLDIIQKLLAYNMLTTSPENTLKSLNKLNRLFLEYYKYYQKLKVNSGQKKKAAEKSFVKLLDTKSLINVVDYNNAIIKSLELFFSFKLDENLYSTKVKTILLMLQQCQKSYHAIEQSLIILNAIESKLTNKIDNQSIILPSLTNITNEIVDKQLVLLEKHIGYPINLLSSCLDLKSIENIESILLRNLDFLIDDIVLNF